MLVERPDRAFGRQPPGDDVAAGPAPGEAVAAEQDEGTAALAGDGVGVGQHHAQVVAEGAAHAAGDAAAGGADSDEQQGRFRIHLKNLPKSPSRMDFSS